MPDNEVHGPLSLLGILIAGVVQSASASRIRGAERRARWEAARAEHQARLRRQQWYSLVQQQLARGSAGDASADQAMAALRGSGGRVSKQDEEYF
jgi:hypothetical protein